VEYNCERPRSSLSDLTPEEFAKKRARERMESSTAGANSHSCRIGGQFSRTRPLLERMVPTSGMAHWSQAFADIRRASKATRLERRDLLTVAADLPAGARFAKTASILNVRTALILRGRAVCKSPGSRASQLGVPCAYFERQAAGYAASKIYGPSARCDPGAGRVASWFVHHQSRRTVREGSKLIGHRTRHRCCAGGRAGVAARQEITRVQVDATCMCRT
jgi:hypothetical protein